LKNSPRNGCLRGPRSKACLQHFNVIILLLILFLAGADAGRGQKNPAPAQPTPAQAAPFRVLVMAARVKDHAKMIAAAQPFFEQMAAHYHFVLDFTDDTSAINDNNLARYQVFVMLQLAPFDMSYGQQLALQKFAESGHGFVGIHAAGLTGTSFLAPNSHYWQWFEDFLGGVIYSAHPAYQKATVVLEDRRHPTTRNLPKTFSLADEWYEFNHSPRNNVHVLASVDESSYHPIKPMGDHPIVWTNTAYRRMIYIAIGSDPSLFADSNYSTLLRDAIRWAASPSNYIPPVSTKNGKVYYQKTYPYDPSISRTEAYHRALQWYTQTFSGADKTVETIDPEAGIIGGTAHFKLTTGGVPAVSREGADGRSVTPVRPVPSNPPVPSIRSIPRAIAGPEGFTGASSNHYEIKCSLEIRVTDSGYTIISSHYADKATDKGISNDFSKVEYRWWDYHGGNPWSAEDLALFEGLDTHTRTLLNSFKEDVSVVTGKPARFRALVLYENGGHHVEYSARARKWLDTLALDSNFRVDYITNTDSISDAFLANYQLIIQLDYAPYAWKPVASTAFQHYIEEGRGGWIGFHHATLLGEFDGYPMWQWFSDFMGGIRWKDYIARFAKATVRLEDHGNPVLEGVPDSFVVRKEEWYTYDRSPRPNVRVLAHVDESSYFPDTTIKMGDHPVIWTNPKPRARNVYIFMGHSPILFEDSVYTRIFRNAIFWAAATKPLPAPHFKALAFYTTTVETDHVDFAGDAIRFFSRAAGGGDFLLDTTSDWSNMNLDKLKQYQVVLWLNDFPQNASQRTAFEQYIEAGGAWLGFHVSAYNDSYTHWPWFIRFLGGAVFKDNSWPPLPARLIVDDTLHPVTLGLPGRYTSPVNEWYRWDPDPRLDKKVKVLVTLDPAQYPLGKKDRIRSGDVPVVWTNTRYKMLYMNMGHGDQIFTSEVQNRMFEAAIRWLGNAAPTGRP
jgi:type 1 glutamine amidotransferase